MTTYLAKRLIQGLVVLILVSMACFAMFRFTGDPVLALVGENATQEDREEARIAYGLDRPTHEQYFNFIKGVVHGDFGKSYVSKIDAFDTIIERFPATLELAMMAMCISFICGVGLGIIVSISPNGVVSRMIMAGSLFGISIPTFLIGILLVIFFSVFLNILPSFGRGDTVQIGFWRTGLLRFGTWSIP